MLGQDLSWIEIFRSALRHNLGVLRGHVGKDVLFSPCLKSNAYGHDLRQTASFLAGEGVTHLCVDSLEEALLIRQTGFQGGILILGYVQKHEIAMAIDLEIKLLIYEKAIARELAKIAVKKKKPLLVHLKIDTGMSRQGVPAEEALSFIDFINNLGGLMIEGVATHYAVADELGNPDFFRLQLRRFLNLKKQLVKRGLNVPLWHSANSAALLAHFQTHFNMVRPGLSLYGEFPSSSLADFCFQKNIVLQPTLAFKTKIAALKKIPPNSFISYGCSFRTKKKTAIAILPIGYNDGINRKRGNRGAVLIKGEKAPIVGNVCMNITIVDVTHIPRLKLEDEVVIIGSQRNPAGETANISLSEIAAEIESIPYEVLTQLREGIPRYHL